MKENQTDTAASGQLFPAAAPAGFTTDELLACVSREVEMRRRCYPGWDKVKSVADLKPTRKKELAMMEAVGQRLREADAQPAPASDALLAELEALMRVADPQRCYIHDDSDGVTISLYLSPDPSGKNEAGQYTDFASFSKPADAELVQALYAHLPALLARVRQAEGPRWVSVAERLPEQPFPIDRQFLVWVDNPASHTLAYLSACLYNPSTQSWYGRSDFSPTVGVTHWQPLPTTPTAAADNGTPARG